MSKEQGLDTRIARHIGSAIGALGFYSHVLTQELANSAEMALLHLNPFSATTEQMRLRHPHTWTGESLRAGLKRQGVSEGRLRAIEGATGKDLNEIYPVGEAKALPGGTQHVVGRIQGEADHGVYVEVDGSEDVGTARYYVGLKGLQKGGKSYTWEEISSSMQ